MGTFADGSATNLASPQARAILRSHWTSTASSGRVWAECWRWP